MRITLQTARLAIGQMQFNKLSNPERLSRVINPFKTSHDTEYIKELFLHGVDASKPIFRK